jgi:sex comb on midleg-like protein 4
MCQNPHYILQYSLICFSVCVYINRGCRCGPVLSAKRVAQLPDQLGPGSIRRVLRGAVQACVDCSHDQSTVYNLLREGNGRVVITGMI